MGLAIRAVCLGLAGPALATVSAVAADWQVLGEKVVDFRENPEVVTARPDAGAFARIKIEVRQANIEIESVKVNFNEGRAFDVPLNAYVGAGSSRVIDLPSAKQIARIELNCRSASLAAEGRVAVVRILASN